MNDNYSRPESPTAGNQSSSCRFCGCYHPTHLICPGAKAVDFYRDGSVKRIEFGDGSWSAPLPPEKPATNSDIISFVHVR